ncbi:MAG: hypothetical protein GWN84_26735, partial [Gammaproteobacteria bacterium]|nr:hypothetical protein [Gammaproteobacteria bacterium]NIR85992.1 hypothetical protein [Gammaproteobacteria bacterium]NIU07233.1 hypothetical protein [Gammaproteobacteria bacterium]NIV54039.1 hypothetical protein [Gammaproteobacteria bacterium]NIX88506.1 hypothetical protein [Gammaproteobacteria bacterium]
MTFPTDVYACDKRSAEICTRMTQAGFAHDPERARDLSAHLWSLERDARERADRAAGK